MAGSIIRLPYPRPGKLSNPFYEYPPEFLEEWISKPDAEFTSWDFRCLLGPLPAGTYEEAAYFYPLAFDYILAHDKDSFDLVTSLVWFASEYRGHLRGDGVLDSVRDRLVECLAAR